MNISVFEKNYYAAVDQGGIDTESKHLLVVTEITIWRMLFYFHALAAAYSGEWLHIVRLHQRR